MRKHIKSKNGQFSFWFPGCCSEYGLNVCELDFCGEDDRIPDEFRGLLFPIDKLDSLIEFLNEAKGNL